MRLGLRYARGLREEAARALLEERARAPFTSIDDLARRVPDLRKNELVLLAEIGALNAVASGQCSVISKNQGASNSGWSLPTGHWPLKLHRRDALWQVGRAVRRPGPLLRDLPEDGAASPLAPLRDEERLLADFRGTGLTVGPHPMAYQRARLDALGVRRASELGRLPQGRRVRVAGCVIARQRPGTARGFVFLSLEDETGIANAILTPDVFTAHRFTVVNESFLLVEGGLQNQDGVVSVKASRVLPLAVTRAPTPSHDFH